METCSLYDNARRSALQHSSTKSLKPLTKSQSRHLHQSRKPLSYEHSHFAADQQEERRASHNNILVDKTSPPPTKWRFTGEQQPPQSTFSNIVNSSYELHHLPR